MTDFVVLYHTQKLFDEHTLLTSGTKLCDFLEESEAYVMDLNYILH